MAVHLQAVINQSNFPAGKRGFNFNISKCLKTGQAQSVLYTVSQSGNVPNKQIIHLSLWFPFLALHITKNVRKDD